MSDLEKPTADQLADWKAEKRALKLVQDSEKPPLHHKKTQEPGSNLSGSTRTGLMKTETL